MTFKESVHQHCMELVSTKISLLQQTLRDLKESASNETKSTAGDKHETALAMLQIEQENTSYQLKNLLSQRLLLEKIALPSQAKHIANGALVKTNYGYFFLSIGLGKIHVDGIRVIALSPQSPLGSRLTGLSQGETIALNGVNYLVESFE